jgi:hypothetical protein
MKKCTKCGIEKDLRDFHKNNGVKSGKQAQCKICVNAACRAYKHSEQGKKTIRAHEETPSRRAAKLENAKRYNKTARGKAMAKKSLKRRMQKRDS